MSLFLPCLEQKEEKFRLSGSRHQSRTTCQVWTAYPGERVYDIRCPMKLQGNSGWNVPAPVTGPCSCTKDGVCWGRWELAPSLHLSWLSEALQAGQRWHGSVKSQLISNIRKGGLGKVFALDGFLLPFSNHSKELPPTRNWSYHLKMPFF